WDPDLSRATVRPGARSRGTTVTVRELFANVPARRKFLKSTDAELRAILAIIWSYALPYPARSFRVEHNERLVADFPAVSTSRDRVLQVLGQDVARDLAEITFSTGDCVVGGFVTRTSPYGSRRNQFFFVNGRLVRDRVLTHAAARATGAFQSNQHPALVVFLHLEPSAVDVNVHPAKTEVRFRDSGRVHVAIEEGVRRAIGAPAEGRELLGLSSISEPPVGPLLVPPGDRSGEQAATVGEVYTPWIEPLTSPREHRFHEITPLFRQAPVVQPPSAPAAIDLGDLRGKIIGQYRSSYILVDSPEGLRLIDQHAAHERILFERLEQGGTGTAAGTQRLLQPVVYDPGAAAAAALESHLDELRETGFEIERFSGSSFAVSAIPSILGRDSIERFLHKLLDASLDRELSHLADARQKLHASLACHAAIKVHRPLSGAEMSRLVADLLACENAFACPHGRPVIVDIRHPDIERHFYRR
ncbi:MAG TPA: hypothetical protein VM534_10535, partial [Thermoanaerobaculia bacterium]|nr:hypothetical protein [Thermoanaerobaculia bacterium]